MGNWRASGDVRRESGLKGGRRLEWEDAQRCWSEGGGIGGGRCWWC
jgi:hypothetical protein